LQLDPEMVAVPYQPPGPPPPMNPDGTPMQVPPEMMAPPPPPIQVPPVLETDDDADHVRKHATLLATPGARGNPALVQIVGAHNAWHMNNMVSKSPQLAMILGQAPPPMPMMPGPPPGGEKAKGPNGVQGVRQPKQLVPPPEATPPAAMGP